MSLAKKVTLGTLWVSGGIVLSRLANFFSAIILARLIDPHNYGLVAISGTVIGLTEQTTAFFLETALVQKDGDITKYLNTAWTTNVFRYIILYIILFFTAPYIGLFFEEPGAVSVIRVSAISFFLTGLRNIGIVYFRKEMEFRKQVILDTVGALVTIGSSVGLGYYFRDVWALVYSGLIGGLITLILSYALHSFRPRFEFQYSKLKELFSYGIWIFGKSIIVMLKTNGLNIFLGKMYGVTPLGYYNRAYAFSTNIFSQINEIVWKVNFPAFCSISTEREKIKNIFLFTQKLLMMSVIPMIILWALHSKEFVVLFLTVTWIPIIPIIIALCLFAILGIMNSLPHIVLDALGYPKLNARIMSLDLVISFILIYPLTVTYGIVGAIYSLCVGQIVTIILTLFTLIKKVDIELKTIITIFLFTIACNAPVLFLAYLKNTYLHPTTNIFTFFISLIVFGSVYVLLSYFLDKLISYGVLPQIRLLFQNHWFRKIE